jgi:cellobiose phosphorylase
MSGDTSRSKIYPCLPEYFNSEGRGMYSYLTGSASWFMLALLTQAYGVRGKDGDLMIEPKLCLEQFGKSPAISIKRMFAGRRLWVSFSNPKRLDFGEYRITASRLNGRSLAVRPNVFLVIPRSLLLKEPGNKPCRIEISLG